MLLNILADEIHRAHQRCMREESCDVNQKKMDFVFEAGAQCMSMMQGAYSCIALIKGVGLLAFRDPYAIRCDGWFRQAQAQLKLLTLGTLSARVNMCR